MDQPAPVSHTNDMYCMGRQAPSASSPAEELLKAVKFTCQLNYSAHAADASRPGSQALGWLPDRNAGRISAVPSEQDAAPTAVAAPALIPDRPSCTYVTQQGKHAFPGCKRSATHACIKLTVGSDRSAGSRPRSQQPHDLCRPSLVVTDQHVVAGT